MLLDRNKKLGERLISFAINVVKVCKNIPTTPVTLRLVPQVVASSNSVSANYSEACKAESRADFLHKLGIVLKEANETRSHLRVLYVAVPDLKNEILDLGKESTEIIKIFSSIKSKFK